jgi:hypothetical protein
MADPKECQLLIPVKMLWCTKNENHRPSSAVQQVTAADIINFSLNSFFNIGLEFKVKISKGKIAVENLKLVAGYLKISHDCHRWSSVVVGPCQVSFELRRPQLQPASDFVSPPRREYSPAVLPVPWSSRESPKKH